MGWMHEAVGEAQREDTSAGQGGEETMKAPGSRAPQYASRGSRLFPVNGMQFLGRGNRGLKHSQGG